MSWNRRRFLCTVGLGCGATALGAGCEVAELRSTGAQPDTFAFDVADPALAALAQVGGMAAADAGTTKLLLIRAAPGQVLALGRVCSHAQQEMTPGPFGSWDQASQTLTCGWHDSQFGPDGAVKRGPAAAAIARWDVTFDAASGKGTVALSEVA